MWGTLLERIRDIVAGGYDARDQVLRSTAGLDKEIAAKTDFAIAPAARLSGSAVRRMAGAGMRMPVALCDQNPALWGTSICGVPVMSYQSFIAEWPAGTLWVASAMHDSAICALAAKHGVCKTVPYPYLAHCYPDIFATREYAGLTESVFAANAMGAIERLCSLLVDDRSREVLLSKVFFYLTHDKGLLSTIRSPEMIYWDASVVRLRADEIVVDGGAYRGDTLEDFLEASRGAFRYYYAFEPDPLVKDSLRAMAGSEPSRVEHVDLGLSDKQESVAFAISGTADTSTTSQGYVTSNDIAYLNVIDLDGFFVGKVPPTVIKMDIEGGERRAIAGARAIIKQHRPMLAVSVYHYPQDLWEIPLMMADRCGESRMVLRHYTQEVDDTVCYAIPKERWERTD